MFFLYCLNKIFYCNIKNYKYEYYEIDSFTILNSVYPDNIIIAYNSLPTFHYNCDILIIFNRQLTEQITLHTRSF